MAVRSGAAGEMGLRVQSDEHHGEASGYDAEPRRLAPKQNGKGGAVGQSNSSAPSGTSRKPLHELREHLFVDPQVLLAEKDEADEAHVS